MEMIVYKIVYLIWVLVTFLIRFPYLKKSKEAEVLSANNTVMDKISLFLVFLGTLLILLIYIFTPFLDFADYRLPLWLGVIGISICLYSIWLFYLSHRDLGENWFVDLKIREKHKLVSEGIYKYIRHPMYAAIWLSVIGQALILQNYIAGLSGLAAFGLLYFLRVRREEEMMIKSFGDEYREHAKRTGRIFPKILF